MLTIEHIKKDKSTNKIEIPIYGDDTIEMVKYKLSQYLKCELEDIYLFAKQNRIVTLHTMYEEMLKKTDKIVKYDVQHILEDLSMPHLIKRVPNKKMFTYDDLLEIIDIPLHEIPVFIPIGHVLRECVNPLVCKQKMSFNRFAYTNTNFIPNQLQKTLLLEYFPFIEKTLYVVDSVQVTDATIRNSYFLKHDPEPNIKEITQMIEEKKELHNQFKDLPTTTKIQTIRFTILPTHQVHISAESIFNLLHADNTNKMIQFYTGETIIYKLYTTQQDKYNHKIPELHPGYIDQEGDKDNIKNRSVYIYSNDRDNLIILYENGSIVVHLRRVKKTLMIEDLNNEINAILLPILNTIREPIYQSGYMYPWNEKSNLLESNVFNVKINIMDYIVDFGLSVNLKINKNYKQITTIYTDISHQNNGEFIYNYVSEHNQNNLYNYVVKYISTKLPTKAAIIDRLQSIFNISNKDAMQMYADNIPLQEQSKQQIIRSGFDGMLNVHNIIIYGIPNIHYLESIQYNLKCIASILGEDVKHKELVNKIQLKEQPAPLPVENTPAPLPVIRESSETTSSDESPEPAPLPVEKPPAPLPVDTPPAPLPVASPIRANDIQLVDEDEMEMGGGSNELKLKNTNFAVARLQDMYEKLRKDYVSKCPTFYVPIIIKKSEWESDKYKEYRERIQTYDHPEKYFLVKDDKVILCPKYWSFKKRKAYVDKDDIEKPFDESKDLLTYVNSKNVKEIVISQHGEYLEYPNYFGNNPGKPEKYPVFKMSKKYEDTVPCCQALPHKEKNTPVEQDEKPAKKTEDLKTNQYIVDKLDPIDAQLGVFKYGYLSEPLRVLFRLDKSVFQKSKSKATNPQELLRWGVPNREYSFLSTMHIIYNYTHRPIEFKGYLQLFKREFPYVQNGNVIRKYKKFQNFLDDIDNITHEDAWEFVAQVNEINLIIFKHNINFVELVCPSNIYEPEKFKDKKCVMLYYFEEDNCYEPIIQKPEKINDVSFLFDTKNEYIQDVLHIIKDKYKKNCNPSYEYSLEDGFIPTQPLLSSELSDKLSEYENIKQVVQYDKCIGFMVDNFFIPCYPSQKILEMETVKKPTLNTIQSTITFLTKINKLDIACKPIYKVIDKGNITGMLIETFQYVPCISIPNTPSIPLIPYYGNLKDEYMVISPENVYEDTKRIQNVNRIKYEQYSYIYIKNKLMNQLNLHENVKDRKEIKRIVNSTDSYEDKLYSINMIIQRVINTYFRDSIEWIDEIKDEYIHFFIEHCPNGFCQNIDKVYLSKTNLVTHEKNDYYKRLADEIIRNKQVELFVLKPEIQFSIPPELNENELILDKNILRLYLDNLDKPYRYTRTYDNAQIRKPNQYKILPFSAKKLSWKVIITE